MICTWTASVSSGFTNFATWTVQYPSGFTNFAICGSDDMYNTLYNLSVL